ncbi:hypothetical protein JDV02_008479 [Purpureocillium takamizusanense]|uniref:ESCRT-II complex subunit VPS25 n=1 Tax=Purpureocillium takamizusanense TaxID=2060973 RepID=A0A9Q8VFA1_9HYPO|nr:uncharacterized protein JDV02_008479 [Purpureocillium takamizusanense]UNI22607.1 hypothetical protein JDV02_008479 [Purpureocillium takamizusanense]
MCLSSIRHSVEEVIRGGGGQRQWLIAGAGRAARHLATVCCVIRSLSGRAHATSQLHFTPPPLHIAQLTHSTTHSLTHSCGFPHQARDSSTLLNLTRHAMVSTGMAASTTSPPPPRDFSGPSPPPTTSSSAALPPVVAAPSSSTTTTTSAAATTTAAPPPSSTSPSSPSPFIFPREYHFPAFFTRQTNLTTHHAQLTKWSALVLAYARHHRLFRLALSEAADSDLFRNRRIDRRLGPADIRELVDFMRKDGRAEYLYSSGSSGGSASASVAGATASGREGDVVLIYWRKPEEWAAAVEAYVEETGQKGSVLTVYELTEGEGTRGTEFHGMDSEVLLKALNVLVKRGKAQIFGQEDSLGVKFF